MKGTGASITKSPVESIIDLILAYLLSVSCVYAITTTMQIGMGLTVLLPVVAAMLMTFFLVFYNRTSMILTLCLLGVAAFVAGMFLMTENAREAWATLGQNIAGSVSWALGHLGPDNESIRTYGNTFAIMLSLLVTFAVYWVGVRRFMFFPLLISATCLFVIQWIMDYVLTIIPFYLFLLLIPIYYVKHIYARMYAGQHMKRKRPMQPNAPGLVPPGMYVLYMLPFCIIITAAAAFLPVSEQPIEWTWLQEKLQVITEQFEGRNNKQVYGYFSIRRSGFGKGSRLGGKVTPDDTQVLEVVSANRTYLKGAAYDHYDGGQWHISDPAMYELVSREGMISNENFMRFTMDAFEFYNGFRIKGSGFSNLAGYPRVAADPALRPSTVSVRYLDIRTKSLFIPVKTMEIYMDDNEPRNAASIYFDSVEICSADKMLEKGSGYVVNTFQDSIGKEPANELLKNHEPGFYDRLNIQNIPGNSDSIMSFIQEIKENVPFIRQKYLQVPENLPDRVKELAEYITSREDTYYGKVKAIELYLSANFPYNMDVPVTPGNRDFVDYFLFDLKQGYCTYYASAMTILLRCAGIPARYVEGFMLPFEPIKDTNNTYIVTNRQAHAWVEVYFEGFGWIPFEPTQPFMTLFYSDPDYAGIVEGQMDYFNFMRDFHERDGTDGYLSDEPQGNETRTFWDENLGWVIAVCSLIFLILTAAAAALLNLVRRNRRYGRYAKMSPRESIRNIYAHFVKLLKLKGLRRDDGETAMEFAQRVEKSCIKIYPSLTALTSTYEIARYGIDEPTKSQKDIYLMNMDLLPQELRDDLGLIRYLFQRHILGKI